MEKNILYTVIIYRDVLKLEIYDRENNLIFDKYYNDNESQLYKDILSKTRDCKDVNKIHIIYK